MSEDLKEKYLRDLFKKYLEIQENMRINVTKKLEDRTDPNKFKRKFRGDVLATRKKAIDYLNKIDFHAVLERALKVVEDEEALRAVLNVQWQIYKNDLDIMVKNLVERIEELKKNKGIFNFGG